MKLTTNKQAPSHDRLMFWGELAANKRDLSKAVGRYNPESDELLLAGDDDLTRKIQKLVDIGVQFKVKKHKNGNFYLSDTFGSPTDSINESEELTELTEPAFKTGALSFSDFVKSQESSEEQPEKQEKKEKKAPKVDKRKLSETESELIQVMRNQSSADLIAATLAELEESYDPYATDF